MAQRSGAGSHRARHRSGIARAAVVLVVAASFAAAAGSWGTSSAAFSSVTGNATNTFSACSSFSYSGEITCDGAIIYHRLGDSPSAASISTAADSSGHNYPATYNGRTDGPSTLWQFDEGTGTTVADSTGAGDRGTLRNGATWVASGKYGSAAGLDGVDDSVDGTGPAVRTDASFSVSAWVYLTSTTGSTPRTVVSQDGGTTSGFTLQYDPGTSSWQFALPRSDVAAPVLDVASSTAAAVPNTWTHLVGVYDSSAGTIQLYVDKVAQTAGTHSSAWNATGPLAAGRARVSGADGAWFGGRVDDVRTYRRPLSAQEITTGPADRPDVDWELDEGSGTGITDNGNVGLAGTASGTTWTTSGHRGDALSFDGTSSYVAAAGTAVPSDHPFTVSAWVLLGSTGASGTAVSQDGTAVSAFTLGYDATGKWALTTEDSESGPVRSVYSTTSATTGTWTHLVGVWDGSTIRLYVDGVSAGSAAVTQVTPSTGALQLGRSKAGGVYGNPWSGSVDQVRLYSRALSDADVAALHAGAEVGGTMSAGQPGALGGSQAADTAVSFAGTSAIYNPQQYPSPNTFTTECWFRATGSAGGALLGFSSQKTGASSNTDRLLYLDSGGHLVFGVKPGGAITTIQSPLTYNDGVWHEAAISLGAAGMKLYVDGTRVQWNPAVTTAFSFGGGYTRIGGVSLAGWPAQPSDDYFTGLIDDVSVYLSQLSDVTIALHYGARNR